VVRGGMGGNDGGLELGDMGRAWPVAQKGFTFSASAFLLHIQFSR
jgi:hypothetical protein